MERLSVSSGTTKERRLPPSSVWMNRSAHWIRPRSEALTELNMQHNRNNEREVRIAPDELHLVIWNSSPLHFSNALHLCDTSSPYNINEVALSFSSTSAVGRLSYKELSDISSHQLSAAPLHKVMDLMWRYSNAREKSALWNSSFWFLWHFMTFFYQYMSEAVFPSNPQCKNFGLEGSEVWLAASADRRVSVWAADWWKDKCDLLDWLTFPAPAYFGVPSVF